MRDGFLSDFVDQLVKRTAATLKPGKEESFAALFGLLLRNQGDSPALKTASQILEKYSRSSEDEKRELFSMLAQDFELDAEAVISAASEYTDDRSAEAYTRLQAAAESPRQEQFRRTSAPHPTGDPNQARVPALCRVKCVLPPAKSETSSWPRNQRSNGRTRHGTQ
ncbi:MAG: malonyl-CoA decarboxylase N-terminal domain-containing protein [Rhizobiaceae bacterium]